MRKFTLFIFLVVVASVVFTGQARATERAKNWSFEGTAGQVLVI